MLSQEKALPSSSPLHFCQVAVRRLTPVDLSQSAYRTLLVGMQCRSLTFPGKSTWLQIALVDILYSGRKTTNRGYAKIPGNHPENPEWLVWLSRAASLPRLCFPLISPCPGFNNQSKIPRTASLPLQQFAPQNIDSTVTMKSLLFLLPIFGSLVSAQLLVSSSSVTALISCESKCPLVRCQTDDPGVCIVRTDVYR